MPGTTLRSRLAELGFTAEVADAIELPTDKTAQVPPPAKDCTALELLRKLGGSLGAEWVSWEPETVWTEMKRQLGEAPNEAMKSKVQALKTLLSCDAFWTDHLAFEKVVMGLNGRPANFDAYQDPSPAMVARALVQAAQVRKAEFSDEVLRYIAVVCFDEGLVILPEPLDVAQESLDELTSPIVGRHLPEEIRKAWASVNGGKDGMYTETVVGIQLARMAAIRDFSKNK